MAHIDDERLPGEALPAGARIEIHGRPAGPMAAGLVFLSRYDDCSLATAGGEMRFSIVVVNWNSRSDREACLPSLTEQTHPDLEVVVVDNGSEDGSIAMIKEHFGSLVLIEAGENLGSR